MSRNTKESMYPIIRNWEGSDMSKSNFCDLHGINIGTFIYWERKYAEENVEPEVAENFVSLRISGPDPMTSERKVVIKYANGIQISVGRELSEPFVASVLEILS